jgi:hypothetical protein
MAPTCKTGNPSRKIKGTKVMIQMVVGMTARRKCLSEAASSSTALRPIVTEACGSCGVDEG